MSFVKVDNNWIVPEAILWIEGIPERAIWYRTGNIMTGGSIIHFYGGYDLQVSLRADQVKELCVLPTENEGRPTAPPPRQDSRGL